jgi:hypothetical protein
MASEFFILGLTRAGRQFRPSDWAERLCGVMAIYRPEGVVDNARDRHLGYSPYVRPVMVNGVKAVRVDARLRDLEPLAYHFVESFAADNDLQTTTDTNA